MESKWQKKTEELEKKLSQCHFVHHRSYPNNTGREPGASAIRSLSRWEDTESLGNKSWREYVDWIVKTQDSMQCASSREHFFQV
jgi:hypothetical protein